VFPIFSTSVETPAIARVIRVMQRSKVASLIDHAGVYNCRRISGSSTFSQHAWGNAVDLFPRGSADNADEACERIARAVVLQATQRTVANRGRRIPAAEVIDHQNGRIWTPSRGWHAYGGTRGPHVHVSGAPLRTGTPPCAGG
jgi:hypothetical protein